MRKTSRSLPYPTESRRGCECGGHRGLNGLSRANGTTARVKYGRRCAPLCVKRRSLRSSTVGGTADLFRRFVPDSTENAVGDFLIYISIHNFPTTFIKSFEVSYYALLRCEFSQAKTSHGTFSKSLFGGIQGQSPW